MPQVAERVSVNILGQFFRFCAVGAIGFVADAGSLHFLVKVFDMGLYGGRVVSYLVAASVTWALNRRYTFQVQGKQAMGREWTVYLAANAIGAVINYGCYALAVTYFEPARDFPVIGVAAGSVAGLGFNFIANRYFVFRKSQVV